MHIWVAYFFLITETLIRFGILLLATNDLDFYGSAMLTFVIASTVGIILLFGEGTLCNTENLGENRRINCFVKTCFISLLVGSICHFFGYNGIIVFLAILNPTVGSLAAKDVSLKLSIQMRSLRTFFWFYLIGCLLLGTNIDFIACVFLLLFMLYTIVPNIKKLNFDDLAYVMRGGNFAISGVSSLLPKSTEQIAVQTLYSSETLGLYVNLRELASIPLYVMGPLLTENLYIKGATLSLKYFLVLLISISAFVGVCFYKSMSLDLTLVLLFLGFLELSKVIAFVILEKLGKFTFTWIAKISIIPVLFVAVLLNQYFDSVKSFLFLIIFFYALQLAFVAFKIFLNSRKQYEN